jgi:hypothetical protein
MWPRHFAAQARAPGNALAIETLRPIGNDDRGRSFENRIGVKFAAARLGVLRAFASGSEMMRADMVADGAANRLIHVDAGPACFMRRA